MQRAEHHPSSRVVVVAVERNDGEDGGHQAGQQSSSSSFPRLVSRVDDRPRNNRPLPPTRRKTCATAFNPPVGSDLQTRLNPVGSAGLPSAGLPSAGLPSAGLPSAGLPSLAHNGEEELETPLFNNNSDDDDPSLVSSYNSNILTASDKPAGTNADGGGRASVLPSSELCSHCQVSEKERCANRVLMGTLIRSCEELQAVVRDRFRNDVCVCYPSRIYKSELEDPQLFPRLHLPHALRAEFLQHLLRVVRSGANEHESRRANSRFVRHCSGTSKILIPLTISVKTNEVILAGYSQCYSTQINKRINYEDLRIIEVVVDYEPPLEFVCPIPEGFDYWGRSYGYGSTTYNAKDFSLTKRIGDESKASLEEAPSSEATRLDGTSPPQVPKECRGSSSSPSASSPISGSGMTQQRAINNSLESPLPLVVPAAAAAVRVFKGRSTSDHPEILVHFGKSIHKKAGRSPEHKVGCSVIRLGHYEARGRRTRMEDRIVATLDLHALADAPALPSGQHVPFFAVYDGHGGVEVADFIARLLHIIFCHSEGYQRNDFPSAFSEAFRLVEAEVLLRLRLLLETTRRYKRCLAAHGMGQQQHRRPVASPSDPPSPSHHHSRGRHAGAPTRHEAADNGTSPGSAAQNKKCSSEAQEEDVPHAVGGGVSTRSFLSSAEEDLPSELHTSDEALAHTTITTDALPRTAFRIVATTPPGGSDRTQKNPPWTALVYKYTQRLANADLSEESRLPTLEESESFADAMSSIFGPDDLLRRVDDIKADIAMLKGLPSDIVGELPVAVTDDDDDDVMEEEEEDGESQLTSGSTALVGFLKDGVLFLANLGDSRCVLCRGGRIACLTEDHRLRSSARESLRIAHTAGAFAFDGYLCGQLGVSRAFGNVSKKSGMKLLGLISTPDVICLELQAEDEFLILGCDGIFDVVTPADAVVTVKAALQMGADANSAAKQLVELAVVNHSDDANAADNVSVVVVVFKNYYPMTGSLKSNNSDEEWPKALVPVASAPALSRSRRNAAAPRARHRQWHDRAAFLGGSESGASSLKSEDQAATVAGDKPAQWLAHRNNNNNRHGGDSRLREMIVVVRDEYADPPCWTTRRSGLRRHQRCCELCTCPSASPDEEEEEEKEAPSDEHYAQISPVREQPRVRKRYFWEAAVKEPK